MGTIGIIGAMEVEVKELKEQMQITRQLTKAGMEFCEGILEGQDVVVVRSGVGKVNAAVCTQILIDVFDVKAVINTGIAGSLKAEINIGDLVISSDLLSKLNGYILCRSKINFTKSFYIFCSNTRYTCRNSTAFRSFSSF